MTMYDSEREAQVMIAICKALGEAPGGVLSIDCGECGQWDGKSDRCQCGIRRCCWDADEDATGDIYVYPICH